MITTPHAHNRHQTSITHHIHVSIRKFDSTLKAHSIHSLELFFGYFFHSHSAGMKRESFRQNGFSGSENSRNLGFHRNVRRRDYLTDSIFFHGFNFYNYEFQIMNYELKFFFLDSLLFLLKTNFLYG